MKILLCLRVLSLSLISSEKHFFYWLTTKKKKCVKMAMRIQLLGKLNILKTYFDPTLKDLQIWVLLPPVFCRVQHILHFGLTSASPESLKRILRFFKFWEVSSGFWCFWIRPGTKDLNYCESSSWLPIANVSFGLVWHSPKHENKGK